MRNFVTDDELRAFFPRITEFLSSGKVDFSGQISEAFRQTIDAIRLKGVESRQICLPLDLLRPAGSTGNVNQLASVTKAAGYSAEYMEGKDGFSRVAVEVSALTISTNEAYTVALEGSRDVDVSVSAPPANWTLIWKSDVKRLGMLTAKFLDEYPYYRVVLTATGTSPSITFTAGLYETWIDRLVTHKALSNIFADFSKVSDDIWSRRSGDEETQFQNALQTARIFVDLDGDNLPDAEANEGGVTSWR